MKNRMQYLLISLGFLTLASANAQEAPQTGHSYSDSLGAHASFVKVYNVGAGVSAPELLPFKIGFAPDANCKTKVGGTVVLSFVVDSQGVAHDLGFQTAAANDMDGIAHKLIEAERFKPGMRNGTPVAVSAQAELRMQGCSEQIRSADGKTHSKTKLTAQPVQHISPFLLDAGDLDYALAGTPGEVNGKTLEKSGKRYGVDPPVATKTVAAVYSAEARAKKLNAIVVAKIVVDPLGIPRCARVISPTGYGLDEQAVKAVRQFRFKPAMKRGVAVPVTITAEVVFQTK
jgi:TonB family protein